MLTKVRSGPSLEHVSAIQCDTASCGAESNGAVAIRPTTVALDHHAWSPPWRPLAGIDRPMGVPVTDLADRARGTLGEMEQITKSANIPTLLMVIYQVTRDPRLLPPPHRPTRSTAPR